jgi:hypothetical protein
LIANFARQSQECAANDLGLQLKIRYLAKLGMGGYNYNTPRQVINCELAAQPFH